MTAYTYFTFDVSDGASRSTGFNRMTIDVTAVNDPATGQPSIRGTARVGETLSAVVTAIVDVEGVGALSYQWKRYASDGNTFEANLGTDATYRLNASEEGKKVTLEVSFTDGDGNAERVVSDAFPAVGTVEAATAPTAADSTVTVAEDTVYTFTAADFNYSDSEPLASVKIVRLPLVGSLTVSGTTVVTGNHVVTRSDITMVSTEEFGDRVVAELTKLPA